MRSEHPHSFLGLSFRGILYLILIAYAGLTILPFFLSVISSLKNGLELYESAFAFHHVWHWENYRVAWINANFALYFRNSLIVTGFSVAGILLFGSMASYVLARYVFPAHTALNMYFLAGLVLPPRLSILPVFTLMRSLHLYDTLWALILVYIAGDLPFAIFILTNYFRQLPRELEEAAVIDGAGPFRIYLQIMLPLIRPALATVGVVVLIWVWNDFFTPLVLLRSPERFTLVIGLFHFVGVYTSQWQYILAGANITMIPVLLAYLFASRQFVEGLTGGITK